VKSILISNVPKDVYEYLNKNARNKGLSLEIYLNLELKNLAERIELENLVFTSLKK